MRSRTGWLPTIARAAVVAGSLFVIGCGGSQAPSTGPAVNATTRVSSPPAASAVPAVTAASVTPAPTAAGSTPSSAPASAAIDLSSLDACSLLNEDAVRVLTGTSLDFVTDSRDNRHCFWGATTPGDPQYVEIDVFSRPTGLSGYSFQPGGTCTTAAITGVGAEAQGGTCVGPQRKVYLLAWDRGVAMSLLVNEPRGVDPGGLADAVRTALASIQ